MQQIVSPLVVLVVLAGWMTWPDHGLTHVTTTNTVLFDREVVDILEKHCAACHASNSLAPPLLTYEETWLNRDAVRAEVLTSHMPPWAAVPGYGTFANSNGLTLREKQFLISWVEGLGPRNDGAVFLNVRDAGGTPEVVQADPNFDNWALGEPDLRAQFPRTIIEPGQGDRIERKVVDLGLRSESWFRGLEFRPGDRRVLRSATITVEETGQWLGTWTPWHSFVELPEGVAYRLSAGSQIVAEIYYGTASQEVSDDSVLGLFVSDDPMPIEDVLSDLVLETRGEVAPESGLTRFGVETIVQTDSHALSLWPQFEPGIESLEVSIRTPDGGTTILLFAEDIPFDWPTPYILAEPVLLEAGSQLRATAHYANTTDNVQPGGVRLTVSRY